MNRFAIFASTSLFLCACAGETEGAGVEQREAMSMNAMSMNAMSMNALSANFQANTEMVQKPLATESYADDSGTAMAYQLHDETTREFMTYLVSCALEPGQWVGYRDTLDGGTTFEFKGALGLCPKWAEGPASKECQEAVSACLLARNNAFGVEVKISMRGNSPLEADAAEQADFPWAEGGFFGKIFGSLHKEMNVRVDPATGRVLGRGVQVLGSVYTNMWACTSDVWTYADAYAQHRICAGGGTNCAAEHAGRCMKLKVNGGAECQTDDAHGYGDYQGCSDGAGPSDWTNVISVYLHQPCDIVSDTAVCATGMPKREAPETWWYPSRY